MRGSGTAPRRGNIFINFCGLAVIIGRIALKKKLDVYIYIASGEILNGLPRGKPCWAGTGMLYSTIHNTAVDSGTVQSTE